MTLKFKKIILYGENKTVYKSFCKNCNIEFWLPKNKIKDNTCCSKKCASQIKSKAAKSLAELKYEQYILDWKNGNIDGSRGESISYHIRRYIFDKYDSKCCECSWNKINLTTGKIPLEIDHIDGNYKNNNESNLRLLCPNCHSLTSTFRSLNNGKGRKIRTNKIVC